VQHDVDGEVRAEDVFADVTGGVCVVEGRGNALLRNGHLAADVQEALRQTGGVARNQTAFDQLVRIAFHQEAVLIGARLRFVTVDNEVARPHALGREAPFDARRETSATATEHR
jgi:hypothetical protein